MQKIFCIVSNLKSVVSPITISTYKNPTSKRITINTQCNRFSDWQMGVYLQLCYIYVIYILTATESSDICGGEVDGEVNGGRGSEKSRWSCVDGVRQTRRAWVVNVFDSVLRDFEVRSGWTGSLQSSFRIGCCGEKTEYLWECWRQTSEVLLLDHLEESLWPLWQWLFSHVHNLIMTSSHPSSLSGQLLSSLKWKHLPSWWQTSRNIDL